MSKPNALGFVPMSTSASIKATTTTAAAKTSQSCPDLSKASGKVVADYLTSARFLNDKSGLEAFMQELNTSVPPSSLSTSAVSPLPPPPASLPVPSSFGALLYTAQSVQLITPRGRFNMSVHESGLVFTTPKNESFNVERAAVRDSVIFSKVRARARAAGWTQHSANATILTPSTSIWIRLAAITAARPVHQEPRQSHLQDDARELQRARSFQEEQGRFVESS